MSKNRIIAMTTTDGRFQLDEQKIPELLPGMVLVSVKAALVSPGSNLGGGWKSFSERQKDSSAEIGAKPLGYANAGIVVSVGKGVTRFSEGDRVACIGAGHAFVSDYTVVPHNLCVKLDERVSFENGSYIMLLATALHALRRGDPNFGEFTAVAGLGIVGQLVSRLFQLSGNYVIGWGTFSLRVQLARKWGIDAAVEVGKEDELAATMAFTEGNGLDSAVMAFGGDGNRAINNLIQCMKVSPDGHGMGCIVIVGNPTFEFRSPLNNIDIRRSSRVGSGYHDKTWERGNDYPPVFMRWTTRTNLELSVRLLAEKKVDVESLTTHQIPLRDIEARMPEVLAKPEDILGVVFVN